MKISEITDREIRISLNALKLFHDTNWLAWLEKLTALEPRTDEKIDWWDVEELIKGGFSSTEAVALIFVISNEECMGQAVNTIDLLDRYFTYTFKPLC